MKAIPLYSGNGKSYSTKYEDDMHRADKTRCIADEGKILYLDDENFYCRDIVNERVDDIVEMVDTTQEANNEN